MAKITLNGVDALTESGGVVTIPGAANLTLGTGAVPSAAIQDDAVTTAKLQDDAVTSAKLDTNIAVGGTLGVTGATTLSITHVADASVTSAKLDTNIQVAGTLGVTGATTLTGAATTGGNLTVGGDLTVTGNSTVNGTTTTINSTTLTVDDKNIEMGSVASPSDTTADGGGITLKGTTDKTILWENDTDSWNFNQNIETSTTKKIKQKGAFMQSSTHQSLVLGG